jgi:glucosamine kinase
MAGTLLIGIDGGGTQCRARLCDRSGRVLGEGVGGPANVRLDPALVMQSILTASRAAAESAGLSESDLQRAHAGFGLAGAALGSARTRLLEQPHPFPTVEIETDAYASWLGAFNGGDGAILILGTGSAGLAVVGGRQFEVGGWGAEVSDEASGQWIGREAIRRSMWALDGRAPGSPLTEAILAHFGGSAEQVIAFSTPARPADYAAFVPLVFAHAEARDPLALALISEAAADAARMINRLVARGAPSVCLIGGLAEPLSAWLPPPVRARLGRPRGDSLDGAVLLARRGSVNDPADAVEAL